MATEFPCKTDRIHCGNASAYTEDHPASFEGIPEALHSRVTAHVPPDTPAAMTPSPRASLHGRRPERVFMANRGDDLVLAGAPPTRSTPSSSPFNVHHRSTVFILAVDLVLLGYGAIALATMFNTDLGMSGSVVLAVVFGSVWAGYRRRKPWAYWPAVAAMSLTFLFFMALVLLYLWSGLRGDLLNLLLAFLMLWAAVGTIRRVRVHLLPTYRAAYAEKPIDLEASLEPGEMLAACPHCLAVLAIRPEALSGEDRCPHCDGALVSSDMVARHDEEA
tara:strand:- start:5885 stop:6712 length:828 start_codon:yes stop_codon:yes gene_type:complete